MMHFGKFLPASSIILDVGTFDECDVIYLHAQQKGVGLSNLGLGLSNL